MGIIKDILLGGAAWKALKRSDRPGVIAPPNCTLLGMSLVKVIPASNALA